MVERLSPDTAKPCGDFDPNKKYTNHLSVLIDAIGYDGMMRVKTALSIAGYIIYYKGDSQPAIPTGGEALRAAAERVCWFDWSDNDMDAAAAIDALRKAVTAAPSSSSADIGGLVQQLREKAGWRDDVHGDLHRAAADMLERMGGVAQPSPVQEAFAYIASDAKALAGATTRAQALNIIQNWLAMTSTEGK